MNLNLLSILPKTIFIKVSAKYKNILTSKLLFNNILKKTNLVKNQNYPTNVVNQKNSSYAYGIVSFKFSSSNTLLSIMTPTGSTLFSVSSGDLRFKGRQKINRQIVVKRMIKVLKGVYPILLDCSPWVVLHLINTGNKKNFIIKALKKCFLVTSVKSFDVSPYNGCRKKKVRRKRVILRLPK